MTDAAHTDTHGHHGDHDIGFHAPHAVAASLFFKVLAALLVLTIVTVAVSRLDFGSMNLLIAMLIAAPTSANKSFFSRTLLCGSW